MATNTSKQNKRKGVRIEHKLILVLDSILKEMDECVQNVDPKKNYIFLDSTYLVDYCFPLPKEPIIGPCGNTDEN